MARCDVAALDQEAHAGVAIARALFIYDATLLDGALQVYTCSPDRFNSIDLCSNAALHVRCSAPVDAPIADDAAEGVKGPPCTHRYNVHMTIEVQYRCRPGAWQPPDDIDARQGVAIGGKFCHFTGR